MNSSELSGLQIAALIALVFPLVLFAYAYFIYPAILWLISRNKGDGHLPPEPREWPTVSVSLPVYNEVRQIRLTLDALLAVDYPREKLQIFVISDASSDGTDDIVREYASRGVELLRVEERKGKTAAEHAAHPHLRGEIIINTDASIRLLPDSIKPLVRALEDPTVGVATGRDVSTSVAEGEGNRGESGYVGYEMWVRSLETRVGSIVGASGSLYAIRKPLHHTWLPEMLSRDFASALIAHEHGYRAVSVMGARCIVPRTVSLQREFKRKIRTMARGLETLWYKRHLMNPFKHGAFALMLFSHKLSRWLVYLSLPFAVIGLLILAASLPAARWVLGALLAAVTLGVIGMRWPTGRPVPAIFALPGFILATNVAGVLAWLSAVGGEPKATWEPTRREAT